MRLPSLSTILTKKTLHTLSARKEYQHYKIGVHAQSVLRSELTDSEKDNDDKFHVPPKFEQEKGAKNILYSNLCKQFIFILLLGL